MHKLKSSPSYSQKGLKGYKFPLNDKKLEIYFVDIKKGHDTYIISKKITHTYFILKGNGLFDVNGRKIKVKSGTLIEILPKTEYTYSGRMKVLLIMEPPWFKGNDKITKKNPLID